MGNIDVSIGSAVTMRTGSAAALGRIDQYELKEELGGGGFGTVYRAVDTTSGVEVAVKGLPPLLRNNREEMENVRRNFALVSRLHHPNIAAALVLHPVRDVRIDDPHVAECLRVAAGDTLMVMEYARGVTLSQWRKQFPDWKVPLADVLDICGQIASALDYAHERDIVHRDIKPANVMVETGLDGKRTVRVLDFGLAAEIRSSISRVSMEVRDTSGTRPYMAPEQWLGQRQGPATDQYALAVLACELLTGEVPFSSVFDTGDPVVMMNAVGHEEPDFAPGLQGKALAAVRTALAKRADARFGSCSEFVAALGGGKVRHEAASSRANAAPGRRPSGGGSAFVKVAAAVLLLAAAGGGYYAYREYARARKALAAEVCLLEAKASQASEKNASAEWNAVEFFRGRSKELEGFYRAGKQAFERGELEAARDYFCKVRDSWYWLSSNFTARVEALAVKTKAEALRTRGEKVRAADAHGEDWRKAESAFAAAELSLSEGTFATAQADYRRAEEILVGVVVQAEKEKLARDTEAAKDAYKADRYDEAFRLSLAADQSDSVICFQLGWLYANGKGVAKDEVKSFEWFRKSAELGNAAAQFNLGWMYDNGQGVAKDESEAVRWYRKSADQGDKDAQYNLGVAYDKGQGVAKDAEEAVRWYRKAADQGQVRAQCNLGVMYENGRGVAKDAAEAVRWYRKSADQGHARAQCNLGLSYEFGTGIAKDAAEAVRWYRKAADQGLADAQCCLGVMYDSGKGVTKDDAEAARWYRKAAEQGHARAQCNLGLAYEFGQGVAKDEAEAVRWYRKAAEQGYAEGQCCLGVMYENGTGVTKDESEAVQWYRKAAEQGHLRAQCNLGVMYESGKGVAKDAAEAVRWYRKAAEQGYARAQRCLGVMYENGTGVEKDYGKAVDLYRQAMERGDDMAKAFLAEMYEKGKGVTKDMETAKRLYREAAAKKVDYAVKALERLSSEIDFDSSDAMARQQEGLRMLGVDFSTPFAGGPVVEVPVGSDLTEVVKGAASGTTFKLGEGEYRMSGRVDGYRKRFRFIGASRSTTVIRGTGRFNPWSEGSMLVLENMTISTTDEYFVWADNDLCIVNCDIQSGSLRMGDKVRGLVCRTRIADAATNYEWVIHVGTDGRCYLSDVEALHAHEHAVIGFGRARLVVKNCHFSNATTSGEGCINDVMRMNGDDSLLYMESTRIKTGENGLYVGKRGSYSLKNVKFENCTKFGVSGNLDMPVVDVYGCTFKDVAKNYEYPAKIAEKSVAFSVNPDMLK